MDPSQLYLLVHNYYMYISYMSFQLNEVSTKGCLLREREREIERQREKIHSCMTKMQFNNNKC